MNTRYVGSFYENIAIEYLEEHGFEILEKNYRCKIGEIDIIALRDDIIRLIEVKYRKNNEYGFACEAVNTKKLFQIYRCGQFYIAKNKLENKMFSVDVIAITGNTIKYYEDCFGGI